MPGVEELPAWEARTETAKRAGGHGFSHEDPASPSVSSAQDRCWVSWDSFYHINYSQQWEMHLLSTQDFPLGRPWGSRLPGQQLLSDVGAFA